MLQLTPDTLTDRLHDQPADLAACPPDADADQPPAHGGIVFAGTPEIAASCLRTLLARNAPIVAVLTRPDAPTGRRRRMQPSAVASAAQEAGLPIIKADRVDAQVQEELSAVGAALGVVVAYGALLPEPALRIPAHGWVNLHYSQLPRYRGAAPVQHAVLNGDTTTAATIFQLERGMDTGPLHGICQYAIPPGHSAGEVLEDLTTIGADLLTVLLPDLLRGRSQAQPQTGVPSLAPKLDRAEAFIDFTRDAASTVSRINATIPEPGAWTLHEGSRIKLGPARTLDVPAAGLLDAAETAGHRARGRGGVPAPGTVLPASALKASGAASAAESGEPGLGTSDVLVLTQDAIIVLGTVQPAGKKAMPAADWLRGQSGPVRLGTEDAPGDSPAESPTENPASGTDSISEETSP